MCISWAKQFAGLAQYCPLNICHGISYHQTKFDFFLPNTQRGIKRWKIKYSPKQKNIRQIGGKIDTFDEKCFCLAKSALTITERLFTPNLVTKCEAHVTSSGPYFIPIELTTI